MKHGSLFSGIGGFDLAAQWMGWENVFHCEKKEFCRRVLSYYWPTAKSYEDVTKTDFTIWRGRVDILSGGFPCQPYSTAGKRKGKEDDRHLWPEMLRAIREIQPRFVVGENVRGLLSWNGGVVFHEVQSDLEAEGHDVLPFLLPACGINAPHQRYRVWFIAYSSSASAGSKDRATCNEGWAPSGSRAKSVRQRNGETSSDRTAATASNVADTSSNGLQGRRNRGNGVRQEQEQEQVKVCSFNRNTSYSSIEDDRRSFREASSGQESELGGSTVQDASNGSGSGWIQDYRCTITEQLTQRVPDWREFPTQSPLCDGDDGLPSELDGITVSKHRRSTIEAGGNAVVPGLVLQIFKAIKETDLQIQ